MGPKGGAIHSLAALSLPGPRGPVRHSRRLFKMPEPGCDLLVIACHFPVSHSGLRAKSTVGGLSWERFPERGERRLSLTAGQGRRGLMPLQATAVFLRGAASAYLRLSPHGCCLPSVKPVSGPGCAPSQAGGAGMPRWIRDRGRGKPLKQLSLLAPINVCSKRLLK